MPTSDSLRPTSLETTSAPVTIARSCMKALCRSPKNGDLTATALIVLRSTLTVSAASASPSTSSAMISSGLLSARTFSSIGNRSARDETFSRTSSTAASSRTASLASASVTKYGEMKPLSNCIPSVNSSSVCSPDDSSTVTTPSAPTFSTAWPMSSPISSSREAMVATCRTRAGSPATGVAAATSASPTLAAAAVIPARSAIGSAPAATFRNPSVISACASTVAVVVPSPATSLVFVAAVFASCAPRFSRGSARSMSRAIVTPSLVTVGPPNFLSSTTYRPRGPSVTFTASASLSTPRCSAARADVSKLICFAMFPTDPYGLSVRPVRRRAACRAFRINRNRPARRQPRTASYSGCT